MPRQSKKSPSVPRPRKVDAAAGAPRSPLAPTARQRLVHALGNSLSAARLRLEIVSRDPACAAAQAENLAALNQILAEAIDDTNQLDDLLWGRVPD
jgi:hypothetical protein